MKLDDDAKDAVKNLGDSINAAVGESKRVAEAIEWLRAIGYEPHLTLRLEIALEKNDAEDDPDDAEEYETTGDAAEEATLELTEEDLRTLQRMKIKF
ncbi:MAG TPA: hypothetical protein VF692_09760 [Pyrinomonadaceae bacterium]|jgi:hypothetical protein